MILAGSAAVTARTAAGYYKYDGISPGMCSEDNRGLCELDIVSDLFHKLGITIAKSEKTRKPADSDIFVSGPSGSFARILTSWQGRNNQIDNFLPTPG